MTTHAPMAVPRQPFSPLISPRLQHLQSSKNRQNGLLSNPLVDSKLKSSLSAPAKSIALNPPTKRRFTPSAQEEDKDSENVDPFTFASPSKRSKNNDSVAVKAASSSSASFRLISKPTFKFTAAKLISPATSMAPPSINRSRLHTPTSCSKANTSSPRAPLSSSPRAPLTAPAGRSPKQRRDMHNRRLSAPFTRVDPPEFSLRASSPSTKSALPFSLDAALAGTMATPITSKPATLSPEIKTIEESMPSNWFFDIYEDTPEEEAANLMEHSTLTLDLSSDDESTECDGEDMGKENVAPEDYVPPSPRRAFPTTTITDPATPRSAKHDIIRRKVVGADAMDDGERSPLSDLEPEDFYPAGVTKDDFILVFESPEKNDGVTAEEDVDEDVADDEDEDEHVFEDENVKPDLYAPEKASLHAACPEHLVEIPVAEGEGDVKGEILIWEDEDTADDDVVA
ncbi:hypothetical protein BDV97DRAFT_424315 [Delphinella strobiligena]|nr:hypothetical protein BDV97DRAFT_424310 [Delphinella strobiligena]KAF1346303.1 hypothetical protein BDV97DRAFT_424315 [Delphinella strobiligena]